MGTFKTESGDWKEYRNLPKLLEIDFHPSDHEESFLPYHERMIKVWNDSLNALKRAKSEGFEYVLFTHGWSTSRLGKTTSRSQVRKLMRDPIATQYIVRRSCIQHHSVFVAKIRSPSKTKQDD